MCSRRCVAFPLKRYLYGYAGEQSSRVCVRVRSDAERRALEAGVAEGEPAYGQEFAGGETPHLESLDQRSVVGRCIMRDDDVAQC